ncbi:hypothetical protein HAX54_024023 [Datura stramonium]|uniref:Glycosyltransferase n=1 Tax=Datura stramonium TaxID=4076 RepID=A0ABS8S652_DATST|nr:hypothetical protein [Datura stramonium]
MSFNLEKEEDVAVVVVPFPVQGHLNQLLHLSHLISTGYHLPIHYVGFDIHLNQAKRRVHGLNHESNNNSTNIYIHFQEFPAPTSLNNSPNVDPAAASRTQLMISLFNATKLHLRGPVFTFLTQLSAKCRRVVVIYDSLMTCVVQDVRSIPNAEAYCFHSTSAFNTYTLIWDAMTKLIPAYIKMKHPMLVSERLLSFSLEFVANLKIFGFGGLIRRCISKGGDHDDHAILHNIPSAESCYPLEFLIMMKELVDCGKLESGSLHDTSRVIEQPYLDLLENFMPNDLKRQWALGPFNPIEIIQSEEKMRHRCLHWLDQQDPDTVILVSFGTSTCLSYDQVKEMAIGLEQSGQKFIWILRNADLLRVDHDQDHQLLPLRYEERLMEDERGLILKDWAPQLEILGHPAIGGFMSHCGWNSCMESMSMGVPIAAWPMQFDQPRNAVLITQVIKIGIMVRDWDTRDSIVTSTTIENVVKRLMASSHGDEMRRNAKMLSHDIKESMKDAGVTRHEFNSFIAHITR